MAVKDGLPSTDFSRQNREYIKAVVEEAGGGARVMTITVTNTGTALILDKTFEEIATAIKAKVICYVVNLFTENAETGYIRYFTNIVSYVERKPDHDVNNAEFTVKIGSDTYTCTSADAYPKYVYD